MDCVVAPFDQVLPVDELLVRVTEPPVQNVVGPLAEMVGVLGEDVTVTTVLAEVAVHPAEPTVTE